MSGLEQTAFEILDFLVFCQSLHKRDVIRAIINDVVIYRRDVQLASLGWLYTQIRKLPLPVGIAQVMCVCRQLLRYDNAMRKFDPKICSEYDALFLNNGGFFRPAHRMFLAKHNVQKPTIRQFTLLSAERKVGLVKKLAKDLANIDIFAE